MIERWIPKLKEEQCSEGLTLRMWTDKEGGYVLYTDHLDEIERLREEIKVLKENNQKVVKAVVVNALIKAVIDESEKMKGDIGVEIDWKLKLMQVIDQVALAEGVRFAPWGGVSEAEMEEINKEYETYGVDERPNYQFLKSRRI